MTTPKLVLLRFSRGSNVALEVGLMDSWRGLGEFYILATVLHVCLDKTYFIGSVSARAGFQCDSMGSVICEVEP